MLEISVIYQKYNIASSYYDNVKSLKFVNITKQNFKYLIEYSVGYHPPFPIPKPPVYELP